jgi:hypothetical protein
MTASAFVADLVPRDPTLLREPLLHFFVLGAFFGVYGVLNRGPERSGQIVVSRGQVQNLQLQFERVWQRTPTRLCRAHRQLGEGRNLLPRRSDAGTRSR